MSDKDLFERLEQLHKELDINGVWVTNDVGDNFEPYMESLGHNPLLITIMANFTKEVHEYHFFVEELRLKIETTFNEYSYGVKINGKPAVMDHCYFYQRESKFYLTESGQLAEDVTTDGVKETILRERDGANLILTYNHGGVIWKRTFIKATEENLKQGNC